MAEGQSQRSIIGEAGYVEGLWRGTVPMGPLASARARFEWRQAELWGGGAQRARCLLSIVDRLIADVGDNAENATLDEIRRGLKRIIAEEEGAESHE
jgi:hypothetical protein